MKDNFIVFGKPEIQQDEIDDVVESLTSGWLGTGPKVAQFELAFAKYKGVSSHSLAAVNSCTAALHLSLISAGITRGDEVITTALTFCATINAIIHAGATPVLADVNRVTGNIDPAEIIKKITPKTKAIMPVHLTGLPCEMDAIMEIANHYNLTIIEDCAHAIEAEYKNKKMGTFGEFGCFSFYVTKNMTTGEGGMVIAKSQEDVKNIKVLALHGMSKNAWSRYSDEGYKHYLVEACGYKYNMMDIQAAIGIHQLRRIEKNHKKRENLWNKYQKAFNKLDIECPPSIPSYVKHGYHLYTIRINPDAYPFNRDYCLTKLNDDNIGVGVHYLSIPEHPYYQSTFGWKPDNFSNARDIGRTTLSIPLSQLLTDTESNYIIDKVTRLFTKQ